jgi:hypothetical protein
MSATIDVNAILDAVDEYAALCVEAGACRSAHSALVNARGERMSAAASLVDLRRKAEDRAVSQLHRIEAMLRGESGDEIAPDDMVPIVWGRDEGDTFPIRWPVPSDQRCFCYDWRNPEATVRRADLDAWEAACSVTGRLKEKMRRECVAIPQPDEVSP